MAHQASRAKKHSKRSAKQQPSRERVREYFDRAMLENQPRLTDLIPKSIWAYLAMFLLGGISIYACQQAFIHTRALDTAEFPKHLFDVNGTGNIANWCMSVMLLLLSVGAVFVYLLRRHKADDYKGRYRLWLYLAGIAGFLSFDVATGAHQILAVPLAGITMPAPWDQASMWWMVVIALTVFYMAARLLIEFKSRPGMLMLLSMAVMVLITAACSRLGGVIGESALTTDVAQSTLAMSSILVVCLMTWLNARKVYLDAQQGRASEGRSLKIHRDRSGLTETRAADQENLAEQDPQWDDWDELGDEEAAEAEQEYVEYVEYAEDELDDLDDLDELDSLEQGQADEEPHEEVESEYAVEQEYTEDEEYAEVEEEAEEEEHAEEEEEAVEYESAVDEYDESESEQEAQSHQDEEVVYSAYATESSESEASHTSTVYESPDDEPQQSTLLIPPSDQAVEHEPFDEDAFWEQYDLTKMSRKQLKTMRKKLNRLKRKHAERQRAA